MNEYEQLKDMKDKEEKYNKAKELILEREKDIRKDFDKLPELRDIFTREAEIPNDILMRLNLTPREFEEFKKLRNEGKSIPDLHNHFKDVYERRNELRRPRAAIVSPVASEGAKYAAFGSDDDDDDDDSDIEDVDPALYPSAPDYPSSSTPAKPGRWGRKPTTYKGAIKRIKDLKAKNAGTAPITQEALDKQLRNAGYVSPLYEKKIISCARTSNI